MNGKEFQNSLKPGDILYINDNYKEFNLSAYCGDDYSHKFYLNRMQKNYYYRFIKFEKCEKNCSYCIISRYILQSLEDSSFKIKICGNIRWNEMSFFEKIDDFIKESEFSV